MTNPSNEISNLIKQYKANPLLPLELRLILERLNNPKASVLDFKNQYYRDPLLCAYLIDLAWHMTRNKEIHPFSADHAMSTVGIDGAKTYLKKMSVDLEKMAHEQQLALANEIKFLMTSSLLAAELAKQLSKQQQKSNLLYWSSMAHQFPELLLWYLKPKTMWCIQYRQLKLPNKLPLFEQAKLGFELSQWRQAVGQEWHMVELNRATYKKSTSFNREELLAYSEKGFNKNMISLKPWHLTDSWLVITANWLARAILSPWMANSYQHYFKIARQAYKLEDKSIFEKISMAVRGVSQHLKGSELFVPATSWLQVKTPTVYPGWLNAVPKKPFKRQQKFVQKACELKSSANHLAIKKQLLDFKQRPETYANNNQLFRRVLDLCIQRLEFSRACLLVVDWKNKQVLTACFAQQKGVQKIKINFDFNQNTPLKKFLFEQGFLYFDIHQHAKIWHKLPKEIIQQQVKNFILFSLKSNGRVNTLFYLDQPDRKPPSPKKVKITKILLMAVSAVVVSNLKK